MTVSAVTSAASQPTDRKSQQSLGQQDFLRLLTTQLKQQDPTAPVDNNAMIAQMAQITSASGISEINITLKDIAKRLDQLMASQNAAQNVTQTQNNPA